MKRGYRRSALAILLLLALVCTLFTGCSWTSDVENPPASDAIDYIDELSKPVDDGTIKLRVVTEKINGDNMNMNFVLSEVAEAYEKENLGVKIQIEFLSDDPEERDNQIKLIRNGVLSGEGPDVFLLPGGQMRTSLNPLFLDVELAMRKGMFYDISDFYEDDETLEKEYLNETIMEAGVLEGSRYVLPMYYDIPVVMMDSLMAAAYEIDTERLKDNVMDMMDTILETEDPLWCAGAYMGIVNNYFCHDVFPSLIDYSSEVVSLTATDVAAYMRKVQMLHSYIGQLPSDMSNSFYDSSMEAYVGFGSNWYTSGIPIHLTTMNLAFEYAAIAKSENGSLEMFPLRASDGSVNANVTYWGAVGAGSKHADVAYDFLRTFLQEDVQWEHIRKNGDIVPWGLITTGWPVRTEDSVEYIWRKYNKNIDGYDDPISEDRSWRERIQKLKDIAMGDADFQILDTEIDEVRFSNKYEKDLSKDITSLNNGANGFAPNTVNIDELAMNAILNLELLLFEGF